MSIYYVGYGSNIPSEEMISRCPSAKYIAKGYIKDYDLNFNYYADIDIAIGCKVPCVVYEIDESDLQNLDYYEGYPTLYCRHYVNVIVTDTIIEGVKCKLNNDKCIIKALVYEMNLEHKEEQMPLNSYVKRILSGYVEYDLDKNYILNKVEETRQRMEARY